MRRPGTWWSSLSAPFSYEPAPTARSSCPTGATTTCDQTLVLDAIHASPPQTITLRRMNEALNLIGIRITDLNGTWTVSDGKSLTRFHDGVVRCQWVALRDVPCLHYDPVTTGLASQGPRDSRSGHAAPPWLQQPPLVPRPPSWPPMYAGVRMVQHGTCITILHSPHAAKAICALPRPTPQAAAGHAAALDAPWFGAGLGATWVSRTRRCRKATSQAGQGALGA